MRQLSWAGLAGLTPGPNFETNPLIEAGPSLARVPRPQWHCASASLQCLLPLMIRQIREFALSGRYCLEFGTLIKSISSRIWCYIYDVLEQHSKYLIGLLKSSCHIPTS